jgi:hypothetical protein
MCEGGMMPCAYVLAWVIVVLIVGYFMGVRVGRKYSRPTK